VTIPVVQRHTLWPWFAQLQGTFWRETSISNGRKNKALPRQVGRDILGLWFSFGAREARV